MGKWTHGEGLGPPLPPEAAAEPDPFAPVGYDLPENYERWWRTGELPNMDARPFLHIPEQDIEFGVHSSFPGDGFCMGIVSAIVEVRGKSLGNRLVNAINQTVAGFTPVGFGMAIAKAMLEALAGEEEWTEAQKRHMAAMDKDWQENPARVYGSDHPKAKKEGEEG